MSCRSSLCSESAASELDPHFRSLKETGASHHSFIRSPPSNPPYSPRSSVDSPLSIPPIVSFPLPPRRLRPGEIVGVKELEPTVLPSPDSSADLRSPASLYGVAIGGSNPIKTNLTIKGRAEVQTDGLTSLDLRKKTLRAHMADTQSAHSRPAAETVNLRARNPSRMLAPHHPTLQSPSRYHPNLQSSPSNALNLTSHAPTLAQGHIGMATSSSLRFRDLSRPPRNHSFLESTTTPIPRLPSTRLPYQSLSYHLSSAYELPHHTLASIKQPLNEVFPAYPLTCNSHEHFQNDASVTPQVTSNVSQNRIKFAPLPDKPFHSAYSVGLKPNLADCENAKPKQLSKKKSAWIGRLFSPHPPQASKTSPSKIRREISLPVPQTLVITGTGTAPVSLMTPTLPIRRRSSVNDQHTSKESLLESQRPRSRSFTSARPTLSMVANMVHRSPSRSVGETLVSGKTLLNGSQHIRSPTRTQSLRNLIAENSSNSPSGKSHLGLQPQPLSVNKTNGQSSANNHPIRSTGVPSSVTKSGNSQTEAVEVLPEDVQKPPTMMNEQHEETKTPQVAKQKTFDDAKPAEEGDTVRKVKKKKDIRFRNTLELIPDPLFDDPPQIVEPSPPDTSSERPDSSSDSRAFGASKRKTPARNLNPFSHLRKPRSADSDHDELQYSTAPTYVSPQKPRPSNDVSPPHASIKHSNLPLSRKHLNLENTENQNLCARKLAPKINLTFVDLDHHIGSRFSVNTLFKEVQKSLPDVIPKEDIRSGDSVGSEADPISQTERQLTSRERPERPSEERSEGKDGSSSGTLESPTTTTSISNPVDIESSHPYMVDSGHNSVIEVVKTNGADVVFQMVVPVNSSGMKTNSSSGRTAAGLALKDHLENEEDDLTVISERLVALNKSIQAREALSTSSETNQRDQSPTPSVNRLTKNLSNSKRKINRIENWLSNVPSLTSPVNKVQPSNLSLNRNHQLLTVEKDEFETLDQASEYPDSPIDRHHIPSKLVLKTS